MSKLLKKSYKKSEDLIRKILMEKWDPIGISDQETCYDEYDIYIPYIYKELCGERSSYNISNYLYKMTSDNMGMEHVSIEDFYSVTDNLLLLRL